MTPGRLFFCLRACRKEKLISRNLIRSSVAGGQLSCSSQAVMKGDLPKGTLRSEQDLFPSTTQPFKQSSTNLSSPSDQRPDIVYQLFILPVLVLFVISSPSGTYSRCAKSRSPRTAANASSSKFRFHAVTNKLHVASSLISSSTARISAIIVPQMSLQRS